MGAVVFDGHVKPWLIEKLKSDPIHQTRLLVDFAGEIGYARAEGRSLEEFLFSVRKLCAVNDYVFDEAVVTSVYKGYVDIGCFVMSLGKARKERDAVGRTESRAET